MLNASTSFLLPWRREKHPQRPEKSLGHARSLCSLGEGLLSLPTPKRRLTYCRMNWIASSYFIPLSIKASATRTGALKDNSSSGHSPATRPRGCQPTPGWRDALRGCNGGVAGSCQHWLLDCDFLPFGCKCCPNERLIWGVKTLRMGLAAVCCSSHEHEDFEGKSAGKMDVNTHAKPELQREEQ